MWHSDFVYTRQEDIQEQILEKNRALNLVFFQVRTLKTQW